jgi:hypothetical protein
VVGVAADHRCRRLRHLALTQPLGIIRSPDKFARAGDESRIA